jgi:hypothetical protein
MIYIYIYNSIESFFPNCWYRLFCPLGKYLRVESADDEGLGLCLGSRPFPVQALRKLEDRLVLVLATVIRLSRRRVEQVLKTMIGNLVISPIGDVVVDAWV